MTHTDIKHFMKQIILPNSIFYLAGLILVVSLKVFYRNADADALTWILTPTYFSVNLLCGVPFDWEPHTGYVSHAFRFIIAPSCSGVNFLIIAFSMLLFSFMPRMNLPCMNLPRMKKGFLWFTASLILSYCYTVLVNSLRIILSLYLPIFFERRGLFHGHLTPEMLHTLTGTVVYFSGLLLLYPMADVLSQKLALKKTSNSMPHAESDLLPHAESDLTPCAESGLTPHAESGLTPHMPHTESGNSRFLRQTVPMFWYLSLVLGIPFIGRLLRNDFSQFGSYAKTILTVCLAICALSISVNRLCGLFTAHKLHSVGNSRNALSFIKAGFTKERTGGNE